MGSPDMPETRLPASRVQAAVGVMKGAAMGETGGGMTRRCTLARGDRIGWEVSSEPRMVSAEAAPVSRGKLTAADAGPDGRSP